MVEEETETPPPPPPNDEAEFEELKQVFNEILEIFLEIFLHTCEFQKVSNKLIYIHNIKN